jgi:hypothetical protein
MVFPGERWRVAASRMPGGLAAGPKRAAERYRRHRMPDGSAPARTSDADFERLVDVAAAQELTRGLEAGREAGDLARESVRTPRIHLEYQAAVLGASEPRVAAALARVLRVPLWPPYAALLGVFLLVGIFARRRRGPIRHGLVTNLAAGATGLLTTCTFCLVCTTYSAQTGVYYGALPLMAAALLAGCGLGASLASRLAERTGRSQRKSLTAVAFGVVPLLMLGWQSVNLPAGSPWTDLAYALGLAALGTCCGLELSILGQIARSSREAPTASASPALAAGTGALLGAALSASLLLAAMGPSAGYLLLLALTVVQIGLLQAGAGRPRGTAVESEPAPTP